MTEKETKKGKNIYENLLYNRNILTEKKDEYIKTYLQAMSTFIKLGLLKEQNISEILTDDKLLITAFDSIAKNTKESKNLYVYMGNFIHDFLTGDNVEIRDDVFLNGCTYKHYKNLETEEELYIQYEKADFFEKNNIVIKINNSDKKTYFNEIRKEYFSNLIGIKPKQLAKK